MKIHRGFVVIGLPIGPLLVVLGHAALLRSDRTITDYMLCALAGFPVAILLLRAAVACVVRQKPWRTLSMAVAAFLGGIYFLHLDAWQRISWLYLSCFWLRARSP